MGLYVNCGEKNLVFISKIFVQCRSGDAGFFGYISHGGLFKTQALEALQSGFTDAALRLGIIFRSVARPK